MGGGARDRLRHRRAARHRARSTCPSRRASTTSSERSGTGARRSGATQARRGAARAGSRRCSASAPAAAVDTIWLGGGGRTVAADGLEAQWMALAGLRQRAAAAATGSRSRALIARRRASCCAATIAQGQYSRRAALAGPSAGARGRAAVAHDRDRRPALDLHGAAADRRDRAAAAGAGGDERRVAALLVALAWRSPSLASLAAALGSRWPPCSTSDPGARARRCWSSCACRAPRWRWSMARCSARAGAAIQALFANPLASPDLTGTTSGAALGAVVTAYLFGFSGAARAVDRRGGRARSARSLLLLALAGPQRRDRDPAARRAWRSARWPAR